MPESHDFLSIDLSIDASIIAQQLTLIAADLYNEITLAECEAWQSLSPHGPTPPHINAVIRHSNKVQTWVLRTLESSTKQESQTAQVASHIIAIANGCLALNNFSTLFSVVTALNEESVQQSLESINTRARLRLMHLQEVVSPKRGFWCYRQAIRTALLPCVPFLGELLQGDISDDDLMRSDSVRDCAHRSKFH